MSIISSLLGPSKKAKLWADQLLGHITSLDNQGGTTNVHFTTYDLSEANAYLNKHKMGDNIVSALISKFDPKNKGLVTELDEDSQGRMTTIIFRGQAKVDLQTQFDAMLEKAKQYSPTRSPAD